jgi:cell division control protein 6
LESPLSVFKDESRLSIEYVPSHLPHRDKELRLLEVFFASALEDPGGLSQRILITGGIGTGKTALSKLFGSRIEKTAREKGINLRYVHVNCRINKSLFTVLKRVLESLAVPFPQRGYSDEELLHSLLGYFDEKNIYLIIALDELESLVREEGSEPLYALTRVQEERINLPQRFSLICIVRRPEVFKSLDESTVSTLLHNIVHLEGYSLPQLEDILNYRVREAFRENTVRSETISLIADVAGARGDARYAIEILWRAGKYADSEESKAVLPEHARKAAASIYPAVRRESLSYLGLHERLLLLAIARRLKQTESAYITMGEAEETYRIVCEEHEKEPRGHTKIWEFVQELEDVGVIVTKISEAGFRGKTTLMGLPGIPAAILEREVTRLLEAGE